MPYQYVSQPYYQQIYPAQTNSVQNPGLVGRMVTSKEEVLGVPVDFTGSPMVYPDFGHGVIYVKQFNPGTGSADIREYRISEEQKQTAPSYATTDDLKALRDELINRMEGKKVTDDDE